MNEAPVERPYTNAMRPHDLMPRIQGDHVKLFLTAIRRQPSEMAAAVAQRVFRADDALPWLLRVGEALSNPPSEFDACHDLAVSGLAHGGSDFLQFAASSIAQALELILVAASKLLASLERRFSLSARPDQNRQQLRRA